MPVSLTANTVALRLRRYDAETRTSPASVYLIAFEMKLRRTCETFVSSE